MAINVSVQFNAGFLSDILLLTQAPIFVYCSMALYTIVYYYCPLNYVPTVSSSVLSFKEKSERI